MKIKIFIIKKMNIKMKFWKILILKKNYKWCYDILFDDLINYWYKDFFIIESFFFVSVIMIFLYNIFSNL